MKTDFASIFEAACVAGALALVGCSSSSSTSTPASAGCAAKAGCPAADAGCPSKEAGCPSAEAGCPAADAGCAAAGCAAPTPGTAQAAPTGTQADIDTWLAGGDYKSWTCESAVRDGKSPSPHGKQRVCSNTLSSTAGPGEYPIGATNVKELYDTAGANIIGYAIEQKMEKGTGAAWYWYERNASGLVANGYGSAGAPKTICVGCHSSAGPSTFGHDFVFTQVQDQ